MKTFVQLASRNNHKVLGFCTSECINGLGNMWEYIKNFNVPHPIRNDGAFTVSMLRDHLREFKLRPYGGDLRGVNQSVPAENVNVSCCLGAGGRGLEIQATRWLSWYGVGLASADRLPVVVRTPAGPLGSLKCDPPKGNGRRLKKKKDEDWRSIVGNTQPQRRVHIQVLPIN